MPKLARPAKRKGQPTKTGKLHPLNMRTTAAIRSRLEDAAAASGRSLATEVEYRLERSFDPEPTFEAWLSRSYGPQGAALIQIIGREMRAQVHHGGELNRALTGERLDIDSDWMGDATTFSLVERAIKEILIVLRPLGEPVDDPTYDPENAARRQLSILAADDAPRPFDLSSSWRKRIWSLLGDRLKKQMAERWKEYLQHLQGENEQ